jgi:hypothetical protein
VRADPRGFGSLLAAAGGGDRGVAPGRNGAPHRGSGFSTSAAWLVPALLVPVQVPVGGRFPSIFNDLGATRYSP